MTKFVAVFCMMIFAALSAYGVSFNQCPAVGLDSNGCELLVTVLAVNGSGVATSFSVATASPDQGPYDGVEDTLIGIVNSSGSALKAISFTGIAGGIPIFGFDGDGACATIGCTNGAGDTTGYGGPGVTFSGISAGMDKGTVNFAGAGIANGGSAWFSLEGPVTATILAGGVPEPRMVSLVCFALIGFAVWARKRRLA